MSIVIDQFERSSPLKVLERAEKYSKTLNYFHEVPKAISKSMIINDFAENKKQSVKKAIQKSQYQVQLFRHLEQEDQSTRSKYEQKIHTLAGKVEKNCEENLKKKVKEGQLYEKRLKLVQTRYVDEEKKHRQNEKEQAYKLRKQLEQFYQKEKQRKKQAELKQIKVLPCYKNALDRINGIHKKNEEYALKIEKEVEENLKKNNHYPELINYKQRLYSSRNQDKSHIFNRSLSIFQDRESKYIQVYGQNQDGSLKAFHFKDQVSQKETERIEKFLKKRTDKWSQEKKRIDATNEEIPEKCLNLIDKTTKASFRQTVSTFKQSGEGWLDRVKENKSKIKDHDERKKDEIMSLHLDLRLSNNSSFKINEKMHTMRHQARKLAFDYL